MEKLTKQDWRCREELRLHWHDFTQCDYPEPDFSDRMEAAGLIELRGVEPDDLEESFAEERGIVPGGFVWSLTDAGRAALARASDAQGGDAP